LRLAVTEIPVVDLAYAHGPRADELEDAATRVLRSGQYHAGPETVAFEREFAVACGGGAAAGVGSGLDAVALSLTALGIGPGDEVIVPAHTAIATWRAVSQAGARPVPVDPEPRSMLVEADAVAAAIGPRTAAIVVVHLYGLVVDTAPIARLARERGLALIEDAAQAHGATDADGPVGTLADAAAFSFYPTKNLGAAGDGGMVVAGDAALLERVRELGHSNSSRLDELQAALLRVKLKSLEADNARRRERADAYLRALDGVAGVELPVAREGTGPVWHQFVVRVAQRDAVRAALRADGVQTLVHYSRPPHRTPEYEDAARPPLPVTERLAATVLSLPVGPHVSPAAGERVCTALADAVGA
jgi:dTDP-3-amino-3,4,6-trideoxy-alpha-D-glucose transaminase